MDREEQVGKNLDLAGQFLSHLLEHPSELADIPEGGTIVIVPNDEELADANIAAGKRLVRRRRPRRAGHAHRGSVVLAPASG